MVKQFVLLLTTIFFISSGWAAPTALTYQGRILKADGSPLEATNVSFLFQITDPIGACVVYEEQVNGYNMANSGGVFDTAIGLGTRTFPTTASFNVLDSFNNAAALACQGGSTYTPTVVDGRLLRVQFYDGVGWKLITPDSVIRSVPYAGYAAAATRLGTNVANDFVLKAGIPTCVSGTFLSWDGSALSCAPVTGASGGTVTNVSSANAYLSVTNGTAAAVLTVNVGTTANTVAAGNDARFTDSRAPSGAASGDLSGTYPSPTVSSLLGRALDTATPTSGQFLKFNGSSQWSPTSIAIADVTGLSTSLSGTVMQSQFPASCSASQTLTFLSPSGSFSCSSIVVSGANFASQSAGLVLASPAGASGAPTFRSLASSDLPTSVTDGFWSAGSGNVYRTTGNVGIGTAVPASPLEVDQSDTSVASNNLASFTLTTSPAGTAAGNHMALSTTAATDTSAQNYTGSLRGANLSAQYNGTGTIATVIGTSGYAGNMSSGTATNTIGVSGQAANNSTGTVTLAKAFSGTVTQSAGGTTTTGYGGVFTNSVSAGTETSAYGSSSTTQVTSTGAVTNAYGSQNVVTTSSSTPITTAYGNYTTITQSGSGAVTTAYGNYVGSLTGTNKWAFYASDSTAPNYFAGNVGIGTTTPAYKLDVYGSINATSLYIGGTAFNPGGAQTYSGDATFSGAGTGLAVTNNATVGGTLGIGGVTTITNTTASTSPSTGALVVNGGVGIAGGLTTGASVNVATATAATAGANTSSPYLFLSANYWNGTATAVDQWSVANILGSGTNPTSTLSFSHSGANTGVKYYSFASGNVGIGTNTPAKNLSVFSAASGSVAEFVSTTGSSGIRIESLAGAYSSSLAFIKGGNARWNIGANVTAESTGNVGSDLAFSSYTDTGAALGTPLMIQRSTGNVGIGTMAPTAPLHIAYDSASVPALLMGSGTISTNYLSVSGGRAMMGYEANTPGALSFVSGTSKNMNFYVNGVNGTFPSGTQAMTILANGNVGIGTMAPGSRVDVQGGDITTSGQVFSSAGSLTNPGHSFTGYVNTGLYVPGTGRLSAVVAGTNAFEARGTGLMLPSGKAILDQNSVTMLSFSLVSSAVNYFNMASGITGAGPTLSATGTDTNVNLNLAGKGTGAVVVPTGNVGIGSSSPGTALDVVGSIRATSKIQLQNGSSSVPLLLGADINATTLTDATLKRGYMGVPHYLTAQPYFITVYGESNATDNVLSLGGNTAGANAATKIEFFTAANSTTATGTERMRIDSSGNVGIGTTSPTYKLDVLGTSRTQATTTTAITQWLQGSASGDANLVLQSNQGTGVAYWISAPAAGGLLIGGNGGSSPSVGAVNITLAGNVGIGTTAPNSKFQVSGAITGKAAVLNGTTTIDFSTGNQQYTAASCGNFDLYNLKDGASYAFAVQGGTAGTCAFNAYSDSGTTAMTVHLPPNHGMTTASTHTLYSFMVMGTHVYVSWTPGY